ncbi:hypothetical protein F7725_023558 [Dissostichus mawsoni]|uniref:Uncharacterized protein n=1 Tax=Dissostichus mawsoni TaxID=36200 RepID=A0A7J5XYK8_DISMA|nr:hypothetical protein F7725_023558 [Dissostichus mawsoni]
MDPYCPPPHETPSGVESLFHQVVAHGPLLPPPHMKPPQVPVADPLHLEPVPEVVVPAAAELDLRHVERPLHEAAARRVRVLVELDAVLQALGQRQVDGELHEEAEQRGEQHEHVEAAAQQQVGLQHGLPLGELDGVQRVVAHFAPEGADSAGQQPHQDQQVGNQQLHLEEEAQAEDEDPTMTESQLNFTGMNGMATPAETHREHGKKFSLQNSVIPQVRDHRRSRVQDHRRSRVQDHRRSRVRTTGGLESRTTGGLESRTTGGLESRTTGGLESRTTGVWSPGPQGGSGVRTTHKSVSCLQVRPGSRPFESEAAESESPEAGSGSDFCCRVWYLVWDLVCRTGRGAAGVLLPRVFGPGLGAGSGVESGWDLDGADVVVWLGFQIKMGVLGGLGLFLDFRSRFGWRPGLGCRFHFGRFGLWGDVGLRGRGGAQVGVWLPVWGRVSFVGTGPVRSGVCWWFGDVGGPSLVPLAVEKVEQVLGFGCSEVSLQLLRLLGPVSQVHEGGGLHEHCAGLLSLRDPGAATSDTTLIMGGGTGLGKGAVSEGGGLETDGEGLQTGGAGLKTGGGGLASNGAGPNTDGGGLASKGEGFKTAGGA